MINYYLDFSTHDQYSQNPFFVTLKIRSEANSVLLISNDGYYPKIVAALATEGETEKFFKVSAKEVHENNGIYFSYRKADAKIKKIETTYPCFYVDTNFELGLDSLKNKNKNERHILTSIANIDKGLLNNISDSDVLNINLKCLRDKVVLQNIVNAFPRYTDELRPLFSISEDFFNSNSYLVLSNDKRQSKPKIITVESFAIQNTGNLSDAIKNAPDEYKRASEGSMETNIDSILIDFKKEIKELLLESQSSNFSEEDLLSGDSLEIFRTHHRS
uniref:hypothetical protein n=1 Tax=Streptococcus pluranimalium TaxID=82348 RepID=UPI003F691111